MSITMMAPVLAACGAPPSPPVAPTAAKPAPAGAQAAATSAPTTQAAASTPAAQPTAAPAVTPTALPPQVKAGQKLVTFMYYRGEISEQEQAAFTEKNPDIQTYLVNQDPIALMAMTAAGTPPDFYRVQAPDIPTFILRKMARDLTDNFKSSPLIKLDDLAEANKNYMFDDNLKVGSGKIYGMVKIGRRT